MNEQVSTYIVLLERYERYERTLYFQNFEKTWRKLR